MAKDYESKVTTKVAVDGEKEYKAACKDIKTNLAGVGSEMALVTAKYKDNASSTEALNAKTDVLKKRYAEQEKQAKETQKQIERLNKSEGDHSETIKKLEKDLNYQQAALYKTSSEMKSTENALKDLDKATEKTSFSFAGLGGKLGSIAAGAAKAAAAIGAAAIGAASGLVALTVAGSNYADDVGTISANTGIATDDLQKYQYALNFIDGDINTLTKTMEKQKLQMASAADGNKAAAGAYEKLGITVKNADGTFRDSEDVYWEVIDALGGVSDEVERDALANDLLGKSAKDLRTVIKAGSGAFKEYGAEAERMGAVMSGDNLNALGAFNDKIQTLKAGLGSLKNAAAMIALPFLDALANDGIGVLGDFTSGIQGANGNLGEMAKVIGETLGKVLNLITEKLPEFVKMGVDMISSMVEGIGNNLPAIISAAVEIINTLCAGLIDMLPLIIAGALQIVVELAQGIALALPELMPKIVELMLYIVDTLVQNLPLIVDAALTLIIALTEGIINALPVLIKEVPRIIVAIVTTLAAQLPKIAKAGLDILSKLWDGMASWLGTLGQKATSIITTIVNAVRNGLSSAVNIGKDIVRGIWDGISGMGSWLWDKITGWADNIMDSIKNAFKIKSPSQRMRDEVGVYIADGVGVGFTKEMPKISKQMAAAIPSEFDVTPAVKIDLPDDKPKPRGGAAGAVAGGIQVIQNIYAKDTSYAGQQREAAKQFKLIARTV